MRWLMRGNYVLKYNDAQGMNTDEIVSSARVIIAADSETTATALSGLNLYLLQTDHALKILTKEIRGSFKRVEEMMFVKEKKLEYLQACVDEILRACPPVAMQLPRPTPKGDERMGREGAKLD
jgi:cytochrome P450